jgi:hypothetical protein
MLRGPGIIPVHQVVSCLQGGIWSDVQTTSVCNTLRFLNGTAYWMSPAVVTWSGANQISHLFSYGSVPGQLPFIGSAETNALVLNMSSGIHTWLAGARDEYSPESGVFWSAGPFFGSKFFQGLSITGGFPVPPFYTNFNYGQPDSDGGAMFMRFNGTWFVLLSVFQWSLFEEN